MGYALTRNLKTNRGMTTMKRKTLKVVDNFTNFFAQNVYVLEDGTKIYIDYDNKEVEILTEE